MSGRGSERSPLAGLRVLDMSRVLAGPFVGRLLADLGAEVVKVEPPEGDVTRKWGAQVARLSGYYTQQNVGKRNLCVDLRADGGPELVAQLAAEADILVENYRPGVMARFGLDWPRLKERNPALIMLSISGFGQHGPEAQRPAYASVTHAECGLMVRQSFGDDTRATDPRVSIADTNAALHGLVGVLSALHMRGRTGEGQHIDMAMIDATMATDDYTHMALDELPLPHGIVNEVWDVQGGQIVIAGDFRHVWKQLVDVHGVVDPTPAGAELSEKIRCRHEAVGAFLMSFADSAAARAALDRAGLATGKLQSTQEGLRSPTLAHREAIVEVDDRDGGKRRVIQSPYRFSDADSGAHPGGATYRGEDNVQVLADWLGMSAPDARALETSKVLLRDGD